MPAYNHEKFVGEAIEGVLNQTFSDIEFIVIDDGSQDSTADVIKSYDDDRIHYFYQDNQDAFNAINNGMEKAQGDFWAILNSDDVYEPNRFEELFKFQKVNDAHCLFTDLSAIDADSNSLNDPEFGWNKWHQKNRQKFFELNDLYASFLHGNFMVTTSNLFMSAEAAKKVGGFSALRYLHDYDFIFRLLLACPEKSFYLHDMQLMKYRIHGNNTLSEGAILAREQDQTVIRQYLLEAVNNQVDEILQRKRVEVGLDRLIALEHELLEVKSQLEPESLITDSMFKRTLKKAARKLLR
jgi:glycosyltransferase involved in cell wall biosynthesis